MIEMLGNPWLQLAFWTVAGVVAFQLRRSMISSGRMWDWITAGIITYGVRVGFQLMPFYDNEVVWTQVARSGIGILAGLLILYGFVEYFYRELHTVEEVARQ